AGTSKSSIARVSKQFRVNAMASFDGTLRVFFIRNSNALAAQLSALNGVVILRVKSKANPARSSLCASQSEGAGPRNSAAARRPLGVEVVRAVTNPSRSGALINSRVGNRTSQTGNNFWRYEWLRQLGS